VPKEILVIRLTIEFLDTVLEWWCGAVYHPFQLLFSKGVGISLD
jgi:hypothetical protein